MSGHNVKKAPKGKKVTVSPVFRRTRTSLHTAARAFYETLDAHASIATLVTAAIASSTDVRPITADSTLSSLGINTKAQLEALADELNKNIPGLELKGSDLKPSNTVLDVVAIVRKKIHPHATI